MPEYRFTEKNGMPAITIGKSVFILWDEAEEWLKQLFMPEYEAWCEEPF